MLQDSPAHLLTGIAAALHARVLPALEEDEVRAQVVAMVEILGNLATRVDWDVARLRAVRDRLGPVVGGLAAAPGAPAVVVDAAVADAAAPDDADATDPAVLAAQVRSLLAALGSGRQWLAADVVADPALRLAVDNAIDWHLAGELQRLRTASFARPDDVDRR